MTIYQLHWQFKDGTTEMRSQKEIRVLDNNRRKEMKAWIQETQAEHPLPEGACWMLCSEDSRHFVKTVAE